MYKIYIRNLRVSEISASSIREHILQRDALEIVKKYHLTTKQAIFNFVGFFFKEKLRIDRFLI